MTKVFVGGSRHTTRLNAQVQKRLDNIVEKEFPVVVGDANGADKTVQQYFDARNYRNVVVFCSGATCRNNIGNWQTRNIMAETRERDAQFYSEKDRAMAQEATIGLMLWDGRSVGTLLNAFRLLRQRKPVVIYVVPERRFLELKNDGEWDRFALKFDFELKRKFQQRAKSEPIRTSQPSLFNQGNGIKDGVQQKFHD
jgi:hypothetical protein